jgi:spermidine synthase
MLWQRRAFALLYLLSATTALATEVIWTRWLVAILGSAIVATACVLAAFMGGLGIGAFIGAAFGDRLRRPLRVFAGLQVISAAAAFLPQVTGLVAAELAFAVGLGAVGMAAIPLGLFFPLACKVRAADQSRRGPGAGQLYALDTGGALIGCLGCGVFLIPVFGLWLSLLGLALARVVIGLAAFLLPDTKERSGAPSIDEPLKQKGWAGLLVLVGVQGFCLLGAEALWSRLLAFVLFKGSTVYAFVAMLATVLGCTSLGAWLATRLVKTEAAAFKLAVWAAALSGCCLLGSHASLLIIGPLPTTAAISHNDLLITLLACGPASLASGMVFSAVVSALRSGPAAGTTGRVLGVNTIFAVAGALLVPLVLVPWLGLGISLAIVGLLPLVAAWLVSIGRGARLQAGLVGIGLLGAVGLLLAGPGWVRNIGRPIYYKEGRDVSVAVLEVKGGRRLFVDGIAVAGSDIIMATDQKTLAHLPVLLHPQPKRVLTVGFGSGGTSGSLLLHKELEVDCVEISETVVSAGRFFSTVNLGLFDEPLSPRYKLIIQDAKRYLAETEKLYDIIVNDCTDLAYRSDASLYTREFFLSAKEHLRPGGIAAAWIPLRGQAPFDVLKSVIATFGSVYADMSLWVFDAYPTHFGILVGTSKPLTIDLARIRKALENKNVHGDLRYIGLDDPTRLAASYYFNDAQLRKFVSSADLHSDDRPVVEFLAPLESGDDTSSYHFLKAPGQASRHLPVDCSAEDLGRIGQKLAMRPWLMAAHQAFFEDDERTARMLYTRALRMSPADNVPRTLLGARPNRIKLLNEEIQKGDKRARLKLAAIHLLEGRYLEALEVIQPSLLKKEPGRQAYLVSGMACLLLGYSDRAADSFLEVVRDNRHGLLHDKAMLGLVFLRLPRFLQIVIETLTFYGL